MLYGAASVDAKSMTVAEVISERSPFAVPRYQRPYAWDDHAISYFVRDVELMLEQDSGSTSHFFGGVVCVQLTDNQKTRPTSYEVDDGQQRMATLMLALSCVVEAAETLIARCERKDPPVAASARTLRDEIVENYMTWKESDVAAGKSAVRRRMTLSLADDPVFEALIMRTLVQLLEEKLRYSHSSQRVNVEEFLTTLEVHRGWLAKKSTKQSEAVPSPSLTKVIDLDDVTLEHIYPQNALAADKAPNLEPVKHWLGNLTFFGPKDNSSAGNKPFTAKKASHYATSEIGMTADLVSLTSWTTRLRPGHTAPEILRLTDQRGPLTAERASKGG